MTIEAYEQAVKEQETAELLRWRNQLVHDLLAQENVQRRQSEGASERDPGFFERELESISTVFYRAMAAGAGGAASFAGYLDEMATLAARLTGTKKGDAFSVAKRMYAESAAYWEDKIQNEGFTERLAGEFIGGLLPGITQFVMERFTAPIHGYAVGGVAGAAKETAHRWAIGKALHSAMAFPVVRRILAMSGLGLAEGRAAGVEWGPDLAQSTAQMGMFGVMGPLKGRAPEPFFAPERRAVEVARSIPGAVRRMIHRGDKGSVDQVLDSVWLGETASRSIDGEAEPKPRPEGRPEAKPEAAPEGKAAKPEAAPEAGQVSRETRQPWEMTRSEYERDAESRPEEFSLDHQLVVARATEGKSVPDRVLREYGHLEWAREALGSSVDRDIGMPDALPDLRQAMIKAKAAGPAWDLAPKVGRMLKASAEEIEGDYELRNLKRTIDMSSMGDLKARMDEYARSAEMYEVSGLGLWTPEAPHEAFERLFVRSEEVLPGQAAEPRAPWGKLEHPPDYAAREGYPAPPSYAVRADEIPILEGRAAPNPESPLWRVSGEEGVHYSAETAGEAYRAALERDPGARLMQVGIRKGSRVDLDPESGLLRAEPEDLWVVRADHNDILRREAFQQDLLDDVVRRMDEPAEVTRSTGKPETKGQSGPRIIALGIKNQIKGKRGWIDWRGRKFTQTHDFAQMLQVLRDPFVETFRVFYAKTLPDGTREILAHDAVSSRHPASTSPTTRFPKSYYEELLARGDKKALEKALGESVIRETEAIKRKAERIEADEVYITHNHPTGSPMPSGADVGLTLAWRDRIGEKFRGHIIINSGRYATIMADEPVSRVIDLKTAMERQEGPEGRAHLSPSDQLLDAKTGIMQTIVKSPDDIAQFAKGLQYGDRSFPLVHLDSANRIRTVSEVPEGYSANPRALRDWIRHVAKLSGAAATVAVHEAGQPGVNTAALDRLVRDGVLMDSVQVGGMATSARAMGVPAKRLDPWGAASDYERRTAVPRRYAGRGAAEEGPSWQLDPEGAARPLMDLDPKTGKEMLRWLKSNPKLQEMMLRAIGEDRAVNINLNKMDTPEEIKEVVRRTGRAFAPRINEARRGVRTWNETEEAAKMLGMSEKELRRRRKGQAYNSEELTGSAWVLMQSAEQLHALMNRVMSGQASQVERLGLLATFRRHVAIQETFSGAVAEAGRALNILRKVRTLQSFRTLTNFDELIGSMGEGFTPEELARKLSAYENMRELNSGTRKIARASGWDMVFEAWVNGILSNPTTHAVNLIGSALATMYMVPERFVQEQINRVVRDPEGTQPGEARAMLFGLIEGFREGLPLALRTFRTGEPSDPITKLEYANRRAITARNFGLEDDAYIDVIPIGRWINMAGEIVRTPGRSLLAGDELMKAVTGRAGLKAAALRQATREGLGANPRKMAERIVELADNPTEALRAEAQEFSRLMTWTTPLGKSGAGLNMWVNETPGLRYIMPFRRTPVNLMKFALKRTPLGLASRQMRDAIFHGKGVERDSALAQLALGTMFSLLVGQLAASGYVTGSGPVDSDTRRMMRETGWQPNSVRVGDQYLSYSRSDPLGIMVGIAADTAEILGQLDEMTAGDLATAVVVAISKNVVNKTYLEGLSRLVETLQDPDRYGEYNIRRTLAGFIPATSLVRQVERITDPVMRDARGILDEVRASVPGFSKDLPPRTNIWGEPIVLEVGWYDIANPFYHSTAKRAPVTEELLRQEIIPSMPQRSIRGVELMPWEYHRYVTLAGREIRDAAGHNLYEALEAMIKTPEYRAMPGGPEGGKALLVKNVIHAYRQMARNRLLQENSTLRGLVEEKEREKAEARMPRF